MPKVYSAKVILNALKRAGFGEVSQKGTFASILRQADMNLREFERLV